MAPHKITIKFFSRDINDSTVPLFGPDLALD